MQPKPPHSSSEGNENPGSCVILGDGFLLAEELGQLLVALAFPVQREPFGDGNPGRDAESTSPGEKSCLRLQKAYLQQAVLVTFIKIEH